MKLLTAAATLALFAGAAVAQTQIANPEIRREGAGDRRNAMNALELKAAPADVWSGLSDWTGGEALTSATAKGKVVLVVTWQQWNANSTRALENIARLSASNPELIIVAAHDKRRWDEAKKFVAEKNLKVLLASDTDGKFRKGLSVDQDPDFYLIDRAGQMRFADIEEESVEAAVKLLLAETAEAAADAPKRFRDSIDQARRNAEKPRLSTDRLNTGPKLKVPFVMPDASAFEKAPWPQKNGPAEALGATDLQGQKLPNADTFGNKEVWLTEKPSWDGKVLLLDFWATWCGPCKKAIPTIEDIQRSNRDDLVVIGFSGTAEDQKTVQQYLRGKDSPYFHAFDEKETLLKAIGVQGIPHVVVISTDGTIRWQGHPAQPSFRLIVQAIIECDPGVQARRRAEAAVRKNAGG
jgi:thiol-disulfide isomerase/thioredoxin